MADYSNWGYDETFLAAADNSSSQFHIVELTDADTVNAAVAGGGGFGVLQNKPQSAEAATVRLIGTSKVRAGGTISAGNFFKMGSGGYATAIVSGDTTPVTAVGRARTAAASGAYFEGFVNPQRVANVVSGSIVAAV